MNARTLLRTVLVGLLPAACVQPVDVPPPASVVRHWTIGVAPIVGDAEPRLPFTNRFIVDLSAMPNVSVGSLAARQDSSAFEVAHDRKLSVAARLHADGHCMDFSYTVMQEGQQQAVFSLVVPLLPAGTEPSSACVDRAATAFYQALVLQGL
jgi:hypothetical protein